MRASSEFINEKTPDLLKPILSHYDGQLYVDFEFGQTTVRKGERCDQIVSWRQVNEKICYELWRRTGVDHKLRSIYQRKFETFSLQDAIDYLDCVFDPYR